jgi:hypothetical protein
MPTCLISVPVRAHTPRTTSSQQGSAVAAGHKLRAHNHPRMLELLLLLTQDQPTPVFTSGILQGCDPTSAQMSSARTHPLHVTEAPATNTPQATLQPTPHPQSHQHTHTCCLRLPHSNSCQGPRLVSCVS